MKIKLLILFITNSAFVFGQSVDDIIKNYNHSIDPLNRLDSITHSYSEMHQKIESPVLNIFSIDTTYSTYSIFGEISLVKKKEGKRIDLNQMTPDLSSWEAENLIRTNLNMILKKEGKSFELVEVNDSAYIVKEKDIASREIFYEIARGSYDLKKKTLKSRGKEMTTRFFEYQIVDNIKVTTKFSFENELANVDVLKLNYEFSIIEEGKAD